MPENTDDIAFCMCKTKMPNKYREKGIRCFKNYFKCINFLIDCQSNAFPLMKIVISDISNSTIKTPEQSFNC